MKCNDCGSVNERVMTICRACGRKLHRNALQRFASKLSRSRSQVKPLFVLLLFVVVGVIFYVVVALTKVQLPDIH